MGRQVMFHMTREDEDRFLDFVRSTGNVLVLPDTSQAPEFQPLAHLPEYFSGKSWGKAWLFNRDVSKRLLTRYVPEQEHHVIEHASSAVELLRSHPKYETKDTLQWGRIWADFWYLDSQNMFQKKELAFVQWYDSLAKWIRKKFVRVSWNDFAGPGALDLRRLGWKLA